MKHFSLLFICCAIVFYCMGQPFYRYKYDVSIINGNPEADKSEKYGRMVLKLEWQHIKKTLERLSNDAITMGRSLGNSSNKDDKTMLINTLLIFQTDVAEENKKLVKIKYVTPILHSAKLTYCYLQSTLETLERFMAIANDRNLTAKEVCTKILNSIHENAERENREINNITDELINVKDTYKLAQ